MEFRGLNAQYKAIKKEVDQAVTQVMEGSQFIGGTPVVDFENMLKDYTGAKHCISCGNGTDALMIALMAWGIGEGDAVFVPDFTFFASAEVVSFVGATPIFVDVEEDTFNVSVCDLKKAIEEVIKEGKYTPKVIIGVDLFGLPANFEALRKIADQYHLLLLEDAAQGFGGKIGSKNACTFGDISAVSFFPAKPLGCYGDGGAIFTDSDELATLIRSLCVHGKGEDKYDNVRIGCNSRLDTIQAAILSCKLKVFQEYELDKVREAADYYTKNLSDCVKTPIVPERFSSSWAQYTIQLHNREERDGLQKYLASYDIPSMIYYRKPMHEQKVFVEARKSIRRCLTSENLCGNVLSLPIHSYLTREEQDVVIERIREYCGK